jgi:hypothetical protein
MERARRKGWIERNQLSRRNPPDDVRAVLWNRVRERESELAVGEKMEKARAAKKAISMGDASASIDEKVKPKKRGLERERKSPSRPTCRSA